MPVKGPGRGSKENCCTKPVRAPDLPDVEKDASILALLGILVDFADLGFGVHPRWHRASVRLGCFHAKRQAGGLSRPPESTSQIACDTARDPDLRVAAIDALRAEIDALSETEDLEIGLRDAHHDLTVGGSRAGKTRTVLAPNLQRYPGSMAATDPKGELSAATLAHRSAPIEAGGLGQTCHVIDPYGVSKLPPDRRATFNALDLVDNDDEQAVDVAGSLADVMIVRANPENEHFNDSARMFVQGLALFVAKTHSGKAYLKRGKTDKADPEAIWGAL